MYKSKRYFDILFSLCVLLLGSPLFFLIALAVALSSKGPIFYGDPRIGYQKKPFLCWKFRTMHKNAKEKLQHLLQSSPPLQKEWQESYKLRHDIRITRVGRFLRKTSLDELPQFWNVLKGDLSVVGPRPVSREEADLLIKSQGDKIFSLRPGITGIWQTSGRNTLSYSRRIELDNQYIDSHNFWKDLQLIAKTIPQIFFPKGAS